MKITSKRQYHIAFAIDESFIEKGFANPTVKEKQRSCGKTKYQVDPFYR